MEYFDLAYQMTGTGVLAFFVALAPLWCIKVAKEWIHRINDGIDTSGPRIRGAWGIYNSCWHTSTRRGYLKNL